jgi:hypothetical protein
MKIKSQLTRIGFLGLAAAFALTACGGFTPKAPKDVIQKFKETVRDVQAADMQVDAVMSSADAKDNLSLNVGIGAKFDHRDGVDRKGDLRLKLSGSLLAGGKTLDGNLGLEIRTLADAFYFNISKLESSDPAMEKYKEIINGYKGKWLHLASDFVPESLKQFQNRDEKTLAKEKQLKDIFVSTNLFEVNKEFGVEDLNGAKVYHYGVKLNEDGLKDYVRKAAQVDGRELSDAEVAQASDFIKTVNNIELWIGVNDYYLYKGVASLTGTSLENGMKTDLNINYVGNSYNTDPKIQSLENPEDFNPVTLMMQLQLLNPAPDTQPAVGTAPATTPDVTTPAPSAKAPVAKKASATVKKK